MPEEPKSFKSNCDLAKVPRAPENGFVDIDSLFKAGNGTTNYVEYKCRPGYKLEGDNMTTCIIDGYWTEPNITCNSKNDEKSSTFILNRNTY